MNGVAAGQARVACSASLISPPLSNDRSRGALGQLFGNMKGALGGVAVKVDGSNINPVTLALLNLILPDGSFLIPTPQTVDPSRPFASQGFPSYRACHFDEDQFNEYRLCPVAEEQILCPVLLFQHKTVTFPGNFFNPVQIFWLCQSKQFENRVASLLHTYTFNNLCSISCELICAHDEPFGNHAPFKWSDIGVAEGEMSQADELPT